MASKKKFFESKTTGEIRSMNPKSYDRAEHLIPRIMDLDPKVDAIAIRTPIIPAEFRRSHKGVVPSWEKAARKCYKHGETLFLEQPSSLEEALESKKVPLDLRRETYEKLSKRKQSEINYIGISFRPVQGTNRLKRIARFREVCEGQKLFTYAENFSRYKENKIERYGINTKVYADAQRVLKEGATAVVFVPSRTEKSPRYSFAITHIPVVPNQPEEQKNNNLASILSLAPATIRQMIDETDLGEPLRGRTPFQSFQIRYTYKNSREGSDVIWLDTQDVAGYLGVLKNQLVESHNQTPLQYNPYPLPSREKAEFYHKLLNNVLIFDPTIKSPKHQLRPLYIAEQSILLGRFSAFVGHDRADFWDPTRDGIYKDFVKIYQD